MSKDYNNERKIMELNLPRKTQLMLIDKLISFRKNGFENYDEEFKSFIKTEGLQKISSKISKIFDNANKQYIQFKNELIQIELKITYSNNIFSLQSIDWLYHRALYLFQYHDKGVASRANTAFIYQRICKVHWKLLVGESGNQALEIRNICQSLGLKLKQSFFHGPITTFTEVQNIKGVFLIDKNLKNCTEQLMYEIQMLKIQLISSYINERNSENIQYISQQRQSMSEVSLSRAERMRNISKSLYQQFNILRKAGQPENNRTNYITSQFKLLLYLSRLAKCAQMYLTCVVTDYDQIPALIYIDASYITEIYKIYFFSDLTQPTALSIEHLTIIQKQVQNRELIERYASTKHLKFKFKMYFFQHSLTMTSDAQVKRFLNIHLAKNRQKLTQLNDRGYNIRKQINQQLKPIINELRNNIKKKNNDYKFKQLVLTQLNKSLIQSVNVISVQLNQQRKLIQPSNKILIYLQIQKQRNMISSEIFNQQKLLALISVVNPPFGELQQISDSISTPSPLFEIKNLKDKLIDFLQERIKMLQNFQYQKSLDNIIIISDQIIRLQMQLKSLKLQTQLTDLKAKFYLKAVGQILQSPVSPTDFLDNQSKYCSFLSEFKLTFPNTLRIFWFLVYNDKYLSPSLKILKGANMQTYISGLTQYFQLVKGNEGMLQAFMIMLVLLDNANRQIEKFLKLISALMKSIQNITKRQFYQRFCTLYTLNYTGDVTKDSLTHFATTYVDFEKNQLYSTYLSRPSNIFFSQSPSFLNSVESVASILGQRTYKQIAKQIQSIASQENNEEIKLNKARIAQLQKQIDGIVTIQNELDQKLDDLTVQNQNINEEIKKLINKNVQKWKIDKYTFPRIDQGLFKENMQYVRLAQQQNRLKQQEVIRGLTYILTTVKQTKSLQSIKTISNYMNEKQPVFVDFSVKYSKQVILLFAKIKQQMESKKKQLNLTLDSLTNQKKICQQAVININYQKLQKIDQKTDKIDEMKYVQMALKKLHRERRIKANRIDKMQNKVEAKIQQEQQNLRQEQKQAQIVAKQLAGRDEVLTNISLLQLIIQKYNVFFATLLTQIFKINDQLKQLLNQKLNKKLVSFLFKLSDIINEIYDIGQIISEVHIEVFAPKFYSMIHEYKQLML